MQNAVENALGSSWQLQVINCDQQRTVSSEKPDKIVVRIQRSKLQLRVPWIALLVSMIDRIIGYKPVFVNDLFWSIVLL